MLQNYLHLETSIERRYDAAKGAIVDQSSTTLIFPRYHQLGVVRKLLSASASDGPGTSYLVQHSAGSGKSNSIAWLAHGLRQLFDAKDERVFDTIVVVTDRTVLDKQLQHTIQQFSQTKGVVVPIEGNSGDLRDAISAGKDIIISTLQKFSVIASEMQGLEGRTFAVIIDEAHSSQSGESAKHLKQALGAGPADTSDESEQVEGEESTLEDLVVAEITARGRQPHISYYAFTATPKNKTLELFGSKGASGKPEPFHLYSMRQAIEEGFILDVLQNYTTYERYFRLRAAKEDSGETFETSKAGRKLIGHVDLSDHVVMQKARICLDHLKSHTVGAIKGKGRAMFVTQSRYHAVRYFDAFRTLMEEDGLPYGPLVAFSGKVEYKMKGEAKRAYTESQLNALPGKTSIKDAFKLPQYRLLIVANKYQTGFDEPMLHTMYVDKKLANVAAVQTLSRLNRRATGKTGTVVIDFVNDAEDIQSAFQDYYQKATLETETDPNKLYELKERLRDAEVYGDNEVDELASVFFDSGQDGEAMNPPLKRTIDRMRGLTDDDRSSFVRTLRTFVRLYGFVSQLIDFVDPTLEKEYVFARHLFDQVVGNSQRRQT